MQAASTEALVASSTSDAKAHIGVAQGALQQLKSNQKATPADIATANGQVQKAQDTVATKQTAESLCGAVDGTANPKAICLVYGLFAASLSIVNVNGDGAGTGSVFSGQSSHHLTSVAVPFAGLRLLPQVWFGAKDWGFLSIDIAGYSAFLTQSLGSTAPSSAKVSCSSTSTDFTLRLPCEANASVTPYLGAYAGLTFGKSGLAYVTLIPFTFGLAQVGIDSGLRGYTGWSVGALQVNGSL